MRVKFSYSIKSELSHLKNLVKERPWYDAKDFPVKWPKNTNNPKPEIINNKILAENRIRALETRWAKIEKKCFDIIKQLNYGKLSPKYNCHITFFGPEGKYYSPNHITLRLNTISDKKHATENIIHEILHLAYYELFKKKKLNYEQVEGAVDDLIVYTPLSKIFPNYKKQSIGKTPKDLIKFIIGR